LPAPVHAHRMCETIMKIPWWLPFGRVPETDPRELADALRGEPRPQLVDVRSAAEFARGHIAGAVSAPIIVLRSRLGSLGLDPTRPVVAICLSAHRSPPAVRLLQRQGFDAAQLAGGMLAWRAAGLPESHR
jgi:rhodanese-related sulfurtransferase